MTDKAKTKLVRCASCRGQKVTMGLGLSEKKCEPCKGIGYQEEVLDPIAYLESQEENKEPIIAKQDAAKDEVKLPVENFDESPIEAFTQDLSDNAVIFPSKRIKSTKRDFVL